MLLVTKVNACFQELAHSKWNCAHTFFLFRLIRHKALAPEDSGTGRMAAMWPNISLREKLGMQTSKPCVSIELSC
jgi:hypothetical protein